MYVRKSICLIVVIVLAAITISSCGSREKPRQGVSIAVDYSTLEISKQSESTESTKNSIEAPPIPTNLETGGISFIEEQHDLEFSVPPPLSDIMEEIAFFSASL